MTPAAFEASWFGTRGDGEGDDFAAMQAAVHHVFAQPRGGILRVEPGLYNFSRYLDLSGLAPGKHFELVGPGARFDFFDANGIYSEGSSRITLRGLDVGGETTRTIQFNGGSGIRLIECRVSGANIPSTGPGAAVCLDMGVSDVALVDCDVVDFGFGMAGPTAIQNFGIVCGFNQQTSRAISMRHCRVIGRPGMDGALYGAGFYSATEVGLLYCTFDLQNGPQANQQAGYPVLLYTGAGTGYAASRKNRVIGCLLQNSAGSGLYLQGNGQTNVASNLVLNTCRDQDDSVGLPVAAICVNSSGESATTVNGNVVAGSGKGGIALLGNALTAVGNDVAECRYGMLLGSSCQRVVVDSNAFARNGRHIISGTSYALRGVTITKNSMEQALTGPAIELGHARGSDVSGNYIRDTYGSAIVVLGGRDNIVAANRVFRAREGWGLDVRSSSSAARDNVFHACDNHAVVVHGVGNRIIGNDFAGNGVPASILGSVDLRELAYPNHAILNGTLVLSCSEGADQTVTFFQVIEGPRQWVDHINEQCVGLTASLDAQGRLEIADDAGGSASTLAIAGGTAAVLELLGLPASATPNVGAAPGFGSVTDAGEMTVAEGNWG